MTSEVRYGKDVTVEELLEQTVEERNTLRQRLYEERQETQRLREKLILTEKALREFISF